MSVYTYSTEPLEHCRHCSDSNDLAIAYTAACMHPYTQLALELKYLTPGLAQSVRTTRLC